MSCFFCSSNEHVTQICDIYKSDEERREILRSKNCCQMCLGIFEPGSDFLKCKNCGRFRNCFCCFSRDHLTVFCPDRLTVSHLFPPKIDQNLFSRFLEFFTIEEKYFLVFSFPSILASITLKPLQVKCVQHTIATDSEMFENLDLLVVDTLQFDLFLLRVYGINNAKIQFKSTVFRIKNLYLYRSTLSVADTLSLLSPKTKIFNYTTTLKHQKLKFRDILVKAPNLEEIALSHHDVEIGNSWPEDLLQLNHGKKLDISMTVPGVNFSLNSLSTLMKSKLSIVSLNIPITFKDRKNGSYQKFKKNLENVFLPANIKPKNGEYLSILFDYKSSYAVRKFPLYYTVKNAKVCF